MYNTKGPAAYGFDSEQIFSELKPLMMRYARTTGYRFEPWYHDESRWHLSSREREKMTGKKLVAVDLFPEPPVYKLSIHSEIFNEATKKWDHKFQAVMPVKKASLTQPWIVDKSKLEELLEEAFEALSPV